MKSQKQFRAEQHRKGLVLKRKPAREEGVKFHYYWGKPSRSFKRIKMVADKSISMTKNDSKVKRGYKFENRIQDFVDKYINKQKYESKILSRKVKDGLVKPIKRPDVIIYPKGNQERFKIAIECKHITSNATQTYENDMDRAMSSISILKRHYKGVKCFVVTTKRSNHTKTEKWINWFKEIGTPIIFWDNLESKNLLKKEIKSLK